MIRIALVTCVLSACAGAGASSQSAVCPSPAPLQSPGEQATPTSTVAESKCPSPAPVAMKATSHDQLLMAPRPPGFWCARYRRTPNAQSHIDACYLTEKTCIKLRDEGIAEGAQITTCTPVGAAFCFTMSDRANQKVYWRCYQTTEQCGTERQKFTTNRPDLEYGTCAISRAPEARSPPAAALRPSSSRHDRQGAPSP